jgi:hypothetical protein
MKDIELVLAQQNAESVIGRSTGSAGSIKKPGEI